MISFVSLSLSVCVGGDRDPFARVNLRDCGCVKKKRKP